MKIDNPYYYLLFVLAISCQLEKKIESSSESEPFTLQSNNIRHYLTRVASEITDNALVNFHSSEELENSRPDQLAKLSEMLSLTDVPLEGERSPLNVKVTGTIQKAGYRIEKLYYESLPGLYVPANLYIPDDGKQNGAAILYLCGHARSQKVHYQAHPRKFAELGFVCLIVETIQFGEVLGEHHGNYSRGWFNLYSRGYTPAGVEVWNAIRGLDLLANRPEVDPEKMGVTGISGGGVITWFTGALDARAKAVAPVCGNSTLKSHIGARTIDGHCDCMMPINAHLWDFQNIGSLIAPRPLLIAQSDGDGMNALESVQEVYGDLKQVYGWYNKPELVDMVVTPGGHSYHEISRKRIFSFFYKHLLNQDVPEDKIGDIDDSPEMQLSAETLKVYVNGPPVGDMTPTIQDSFVKLSTAPVIENKADLASHKEKVIQFLKGNTFNHFPQTVEDFDSARVFRTKDDAPFGMKEYSFVSEKDWRLNVYVLYRNSPSEKKPLMLVLRNPGEERWASESFIRGLSNDWNIAYLEVRGIGETGWAPELQWHIRRASAWTGRTIASMRTYDVMRALDFVRTLEGVNPEKVGLAARGEMTVPALYAALLDGKCHSLLLQNPPSTQDVTSQPNGRGEAIEMLSCLRITDINQLPALIFPTQTVVVGDFPTSYDWSQKTLENLKLGNLRKVSNPGEF